MRRALPLTLLLCAALVPAVADAAKYRRKTYVPPPAPAAASPARKAAGPTPPAALGAAPSAFAVAPATRLVRLGSAGLGGLRSTADASPVCRTGCADRRYVCEGQNGPEVCAPVWTQCVLACRGGR